MPSLLEYYIDKLRRLRYVNRGIVFACDLIFSIAGTVLSYVFILTLFNKWIISGSIITVILCSAIVSTILFISTGLYKVIIRHSTLKELPKIFYLLVIKNIVMAVIVHYLGIIDNTLIVYCAILDALITSFLMIGVRAFIIDVYYSIVNIDDKQLRKVFIYSTEGRSPMLAEQINKNISAPYKIEGFLTTNKNKSGMRIADLKVYFLDHDQERLLRLFKKHDISYVIFTSNEHFNRERGLFVEFCIQNHIKMLMAGELRNLEDNKNIHSNIKPIQIEDLLDREEITIEIDKISNQIAGKVVLVTGAAGSIGREVVFQLASFNVGELVLLDNAETPLHNIQLEMTERFPNIKVSFRLGDIRAKDRIEGIFKLCKPDIVFHAAAYKHVPMIESNPCEAVLVNVWGTINVAQHAIKHGVKKFVMVSTDKAVNPTNVMGASKRIAEIFVQSLNNKSNTQFITTRFGNVLGSNGSVIPHFKDQIAAGGPVTVTHPDIIRYFMTIPEACRLVLQAAIMGHGGEIFVFDMGKQVKIADLAKKMILLSGFEPDKDIEIKYTGLRPGEKLYEELLSDKEKTDATNHKKIRIALSVPTCPEQLEREIRSLIFSAGRIDVEKTIKLMKQITPEFISNNSEFEIYDKK